MLKVLRQEGNDYYLSSEDGTEVLLPAKNVKGEVKIGEEVKAFVYEGMLGAKRASLYQPKIELEKFAYLTVSATDDIGVFVDWGMEKDLLVPPKQEGERMEEGESYIIYMYQDRESGKLYGSNKIEKRLSNDILTVEEGEEVDLIVQRESDLGMVVIVNHKHRGLVFDSDIYQDLSVGDKLKGFVKKIQPENRLDIVIRPMGYRKTILLDTELVMNALDENNGFLPLTDKSNPDLIMVELNLSKKAFKRAIGSLYKSKKIVIEEKGIRLV